MASTADGEAQVATTCRRLPSRSWAPATLVDEVEAAPPPAEAVEALDKAWQMQFAAMRRAIAEEMDAPEPEDAFSQGALAAYNHVLSFWPTAPVSGAAALPTSPPALDVERSTAGIARAALDMEHWPTHGRRIERRARHACATRWHQPPSTPASRSSPRSAERQHLIDCAAYSPCVSYAVARPALRTWHEPRP